MKRFFLVGCLLCLAVFVGAQDSELIRKAQSGDAEAQYNLGGFYQYGLGGFENNKEEAVKWYMKAAEQGHAGALCCIGDCYRDGIFFKENREEAMKWYLKAAEKGDAGAQYVLGDTYFLGLGGIPRDDAKAEYWLLKAAAQGYRFAYSSLAIFYTSRNKEEAIYWNKKDMDAYYEEYGEEDELAAKRLRELGVYYHPDSKSSGTASTSRSSVASGSDSNRSSSSGSSSGDKLLYQGSYTQSSQGYSPETGQYTDAIGPGFVLSVKIYDSYIVVDGSKCEYVNTSGGWKVYKGNNMFGTTQYYKVNPANFEMSSYTYGVNPYTGQGSTLVYQMKKGEASFDIRQNNANTYSGGYSGGGTGTDSGSGSERPRQTYQKSCHLCHGSGKCNTCNGTHRYLNPLTNKYVTCPNCRPDGRCTACNGTGKEQ